MLQATPVNDVVPQKRVVTLTPERSVQEAMATLGRFKILSAPVIDAKVPLSLVALTTFRGIWLTITVDFARRRRYLVLWTFVISQL